MTSLPSLVVMHQPTLPYLLMVQNSRFCETFHLRLSQLLTDRNKLKSRYRCHCLPLAFPCTLGNHVLEEKYHRSNCVIIHFTCTCIAIQIPPLKTFAASFDRRWVSVHQTFGVATQSQQNLLFLQYKDECSLIKAKAVCFNF